MNPATGGRRRGWGEFLSGGLVFPIWARREHPAYARFRCEIDTTQFLPAVRIAALQRERLAALLEFASQRSPFYRERLRAAGVGPAITPDDPQWKALPLLTKQDLQDHGDEMAAEGLPAAARLRNQTGGSTGSPVQYWVDRDRMSTRMASTHRHNAWAGLRPGDWVATVWGAPLEAQTARSRWDRARNRLLYRTVNLNTSSIGPEDWERFFREVRRRRPRWLLAYASGAVELAEEVARRGYADIRFASIVTSAEVLTAEHRQRIESVLGGRVFNRYGCREVSVIASECEFHSGLHVNEEALLVEIVPVAGMAAGWGKVVITDLLNRSQPLIRYENGDVACWASGPCPCGRGLARLAEVQGRVADFVRLPDGRMVSGVALLTLALADLASVRQTQLVDRGPGELLLRVVAGDGYGPEAERTLRWRLERHLQGSARLEIASVPAIARSPSGKYAFVVHEARAALEESAPC